MAQSHVDNELMQKAVQRGLTKAVMFAVEQTNQQIVSGYGDPIKDTGTMLGSLDWDQVQFGDTQAHWGVNTFYAPFVHDGTYKMIERPFIRDVQQNPDFLQAVQELIEEGMNEVLND